jgi:hypothetical protein
MLGRCRIGVAESGDLARRISQPKFRPASNSFSSLAAAAIEFTAVQRNWRDFRIAHEAVNATMRRCRKFGRLVWLRFHEPEPWRLR